MIPEVDAEEDVDSWTPKQCHRRVFAHHFASVTSETRAERHSPGRAFSRASPPLNATDCALTPLAKDHCRLVRTVLYTIMEIN